MKKIITTAALFSLLAACNTTADTNKTTLWENSNSNTTVVKTNNGTTTTTTSSSAGISIDKNKVGGLLDALFGTEPVTRADLVGNWKFYQVSTNRTCDLTLSETAWGGHYKAKIGFGCDNTVFHTKSWNLVQDDVVVFDAFGKIIVRLKRVDSNRWDGTTTANGATVTVTK